MNLPLSARAFSLVIALCIASAVLTTVAEMGHPPADGVGFIASLVLPSGQDTPPPVLSFAGPSSAP